LTTIFADDFIGTTLDWSYFNASPTIPAATSGSGSGYIQLTAPLATTAFGAWVTKSLPDPVYGLQIVGPVPNINVDEIYVAHFQLRHNAPSRGAAPMLRLRAQMPNDISYQQWYFRPYPAVAPQVDAEINPFIPDPNTDKVYSLYWGPNSWAPLFNNMVVNVAGTIFDTRSYSLAFDIIDESATQQGTWKLSYVDVGVTDRPATTSYALTMSDLTTDSSWAPVQFENAGNTSMNLLNDSPATGMVTFDDPGVDLTPPGNDPPNWLIVVYNNTRDWTNTIYRVTARLSYPTQTDRNNAHRFRVRHNTTISQLIHEFWLNQNLKAQGNPMLPIVSGGSGTVYTPYEVYVNGYGGATAALQGYSFHKWLLALDQLHHLAGSGQEELATRTSVHAVLYESLGALAF